MLKVLKVGGRLEAALLILETGGLDVRQSFLKFPIFPYWKHVNPGYGQLGARCPGWLHLKHFRGALSWVYTLRASSCYTKSLKIKPTNNMSMKDVGVKIPFLDKDNYHHWKVKMHLHLLSQDERYVYCIEKGPHVPRRAATDVEGAVGQQRILKPQSEWADEDIEQVHKDKKAMTILFNGLDGDMFDNVINCKSA
ncbi:hypothetical protein AgCh_025127 [Apium graveolens]